MDPAEEAAHGGLEQQQTFLLLLILILLFSLSVGEYVCGRCAWLTEGSFATLVGLAGGVTLLLVNLLSNQSFTISLAFPNETFFDVLLPPIIFYQGWSMHKQRFFKNSLVISLFGLVGTVVSFAVIALSTSLLGAFSTRTTLRLGAVMAATDSVAVLQVLSPERTPLLHSLVFGEGVVNDASSIVLLRSIRFTYERSVDDALSSILRSIFFGFAKVGLLSAAIGIGVSLFSAVLMRFRAVSTAHVRHLEEEETPSWLARSTRGGTLEIFNHIGATHQVAFIVLLAYLSFFLSEIMGLSGIMTLFFTGVLMSHYTYHNLDESAKVTTNNLFHAISLLAEITIYLFVGMDCLYKGNWSNVNKAQVVSLIVVLLLSIFLSRLVFVFPICMLQNLWNRRKLRISDMCIIVWAGTLRGAVSVALSMYSFAPEDPQLADREGSTVIAAVMALVVFNILVFGAMTKPVIFFLRSYATGRGAEEGGPLGLSLVNAHSFPSRQNSDWEGSEPYTPNRKLVDDREAGSDAAAGARKGWLVKQWTAFDEEVMKPIFGGEIRQLHHTALEDSGSGDEATDVCIKSENT